MAYIVGQEKKKKQGGLDLLGDPGAYANIKAQLQTQQIQQPVESVHQAPQISEEEMKRKRGYQYGGVIQHFQEGGFVEEEDEDEISLGGVSRTGSSTGRGASSAPQQRSGSFTGLSKYIEANQPKIEQLSSDISGNIAGEAEELRGQTQAAQDKYLGESGSLAGGQDFIKSQIEQAGTGSGERTQADKDRFQSYRQNTIAGPSLQDAGYKAKQLEDRAQRLGGAGGRYAELQRMVGQQPGYSSGERRLDQLLLAGDPKSRQKAIRESRAATQGLESGVTDAARQIGAQQSALSQQANTGIQQALATAETERAAREARFAGLGDSGTMSDADLAAMGLNREQVANLYGVDPSEFIRTGGVSADRLARMNALRGMSGQEASTLETYNPESLLGGIEEAKGRYESVPKQTADTAFKALWGGQRQDIMRNYMKEFDIAYSTGNPPNVSMSGSVGTAKSSIPMTEVYKQYAASRKKAEKPFKFGQGLTAPVPPVV